MTDYCNEDNLIQQDDQKAVFSSISDNKNRDTSLLAKANNHVTEIILKRSRFNLCSK